MPVFSRRTKLLYFALANWALAGRGCSFFLLRERTNQERGLRGLPLRTPSACAVAGAACRAARRKSRQLQLLRRCFKEKHRHGSCTDFAFAKNNSFCLFPWERQNFKQNGKAKSLAKLSHLGRALMRPRWRNFVETSPFRRSFPERRTKRFPKAAGLWRAFLVHSLPRGKE